MPTLLFMRLFPTRVWVPKIGPDFWTREGSDHKKGEWKNPNREKEVEAYKIVYT